MKIAKNTTDIPSKAVGRLVRWTLTECGVEPDKFKNCRIICQPTGRLSRAIIRCDLLLATPTVYFLKFIQLRVAAHESDQDEFFEDEKRRLYMVVIQIGCSLAAWRIGPKVPAGELGIYRQAVGAKFLENADVLMKQWGVQVPESDLELKDKLKRAEKQVKRWESKHKLSATKLMIWRRRRDRILRRLDQKPVTA